MGTFGKWIYREGVGYVKASSQELAGLHIVGRPDKPEPIKASARQGVKESMVSQGKLDGARTSSSSRKYTSRIQASLPRAAILAPQRNKHGKLPKGAERFPQQLSMMDPSIAEAYKAGIRRTSKMVPIMPVDPSTPAEVYRFAANTDSGSMKCRGNDAPRCIRAFRDSDDYQAYDLTPEEEARIDAEAVAADVRAKATKQRNKARDSETDAYDLVYDAAQGKAVERRYLTAMRRS